MAVGYCFNMSIGKDAVSEGTPVASLVLPQVDEDRWSRLEVGVPQECSAMRMMQGLYLDVDVAMQVRKRLESVLKVRTGARSTSCYLWRRNFNT